MRGTKQQLKMALACATVMWPLVVVAQVPAPPPPVTRQHRKDTAWPYVPPDFPDGCLGEVHARPLDTRVLAAASFALPRFVTCSVRRPRLQHRSRSTQLV